MPRSVPSQSVTIVGKRVMDWLDDYKGEEKCDRESLCCHFEKPKELVTR